MHTPDICIICAICTIYTIQIGMLCEFLFTNPYCIIMAIKILIQKISVRKRQITAEQPITITTAIKT